jgi:hypothetical protein
VWQEVFTSIHAFEQTIGRNYMMSSNELRNNNLVSIHKQDYELVAVSGSF